MFCCNLENLEFGAPKKPVKKKTVAKKTTKPKGVSGSLGVGGGLGIGGSAGAKVGGLGIGGSVGATVNTEDNNISVFSFHWIEIYEQGLLSAPLLNEELSDNHASFNSRVRQTFPKLLNANPYTSFNNSFIGGSSKLFATGETKLSPSQTRATLIRLAKESGIRGSESNITFSQKTIAQIKGGEYLTQPKSVASGGVTSNSKPKKSNEKNVDYDLTGGDGEFLDNFGLGLGLSTPVTIAAAAFVALLILRR